jgi:hypothetical protein
VVLLDSEEGSWQVATRAGSQVDAQFSPAAQLNALHQLVAC